MGVTSAVIDSVGRFSPAPNPQFVCTVVEVVDHAGKVVGYPNPLGVEYAGMWTRSLQS